mgnify:CR=1 FL=1
MTEELRPLRYELVNVQPGFVIIEKEMYSHALLPESRGDLLGLLETFDKDVREKKIGDLVFFEYAPGGADKPEAVAVPCRA